MIEFCITVNPDPKKSVSNRSYGALSSKKQYNILSYRLASAARRKAITDWRFIFEIGSQGHIHAHGSIWLNDTSDNSHMLEVKEFQRLICEHFARKTSSQYWLNICCTVKRRDDDGWGDKQKYISWDEYLGKHQEARYKWMMPISKATPLCLFHDEE